MRGVFGGMPSGVQYNSEKRASLDGLQARQQAVALAFERQQREKALMVIVNIAESTAEAKRGLFEFPDLMLSLEK